MELYLNRIGGAGTERTTGELFVEHIFYCFTLEDCVREVANVPVSEWKIDGKTAIPRGRYRVTLENSLKFGPETITINNVPGFTHIRIHSGNTEQDTEGCPIVGYDKNPDGTIAVGTTKSAVKNLKRVIKQAIMQRYEEVYITIR